jgi:hypothetical protein
MSVKGKKVKIVVAISLVLLSVASICSYPLPNPKSTATVNNTDISTKSLFSFTGAPDWRQGPTSQTSMALFGKERQDGTSACFTSIELKRGKVDLNAELLKRQDNLKKTGGSMTQTSASNSSLTTSSGAKQYELRQYSIDGGSGSKDAMKGLELGYVQLDSDYIEISGHCETAEGLATTIPALQAYRLNN